MITPVRIYPVTYSALKQIKASLPLAPWGYSDCIDSNEYNVFVVDLDRTSCFLTVMPKDEGSDITDFEANIQPTATSYVSVRDAISVITALSPIPSIQISKSSDMRATIISHDWTDKTSWYEKAVRVVDGVLADTGDHQTYALAQGGVIDVFHGKITDEHALKDASNNSFRITVKVDGVTKTERDPHFGTGGDYEVNYSLGTVTFFSAQSDSAVVTATYHYATTSVFTVKPAAGKKMCIDRAEVQLSVDCVANDSVVFQPYGYVQSFAPHLTPAPYPANTLIPLGPPAIYKGIRDFLNASCKSYPVIPALGGSGWRGLSVGSVVMDWDYVAKTVLDSSKGMEIRVWLEHDTPWDGTFGTVTFYGTQA